MYNNVPEDRVELIKQIKNLDSLLKATNVIPKKVWEHIDDAIGYNAASSVPGACKILKVIYLRIQEGESITLHLPSETIVLDKNNFEQFISTYFSPFIFEQTLKY